MIRHALRCLNEEELIVLCEMVLDRKPEALERVCEKLCVEKATAYRRRDAALKKVEECLYGADL